MRLYLVFIGVIAVERILELVLSRSNESWARSRDARELGSEHFGWMKALHTAFLIACPLEVVLLSRPFVPTLGYPMLALVALAQLLRYWAVITLGRRWNVKVLVVPGMPPVTGGPYRYLSHPNYTAVVIEIFAVPLVHTAWLTAILFSALNAWMLSVRIPIENRALEQFS